DGRQRCRAPHDRGVLRQHYRAPGVSTARLPTRDDVPRTRQEPVAASRLRCGYPARFRKGITGLSSAVEGLLVKAITKSLTLSLPDRAQSMTNLGLRTGQIGLPGPWSASGVRRGPPSRLAKSSQNRTFRGVLRGGTAAGRGDGVRSSEAKGR